jgi:hypothetical protein
MSRARLDGLYFLVLGNLVFLLFGFPLEQAAPYEIVDFRTLYNPARCLIQHHDPYSKSEVLRVYQATGIDNPSAAPVVRQIATQNVYPPTVFPVTVLFALMSWGAAKILWLALIAVGLTLAAFLIWNLALDYAPTLPGVLIGVLLAGSELLLITGNAAALTISLCIVAVWCFFRNRFILAGIVCLAISLALKPQVTGFVWLYFLLSGGVLRKRALQTLLFFSVFSIPAILWVQQISPHWMQEMHSNILAYSGPDGINNPGPASTGGHGLGMVVSLQSAFAALRDDPRFYNPASYLVVAPLLFLWAFVTLRSPRPTPQRAWLALAAIAALSMLPVYHRQQDTKLLLLAVPACAMLWAEGGRIGRFALIVTTAAFLVTADLSWAILLALIPHLPLPPTELTRQFLIAIQVFPVPLTLLATGIFYLWVYVRRAAADTPVTIAEKLCVE